jgi:hypothetical protein
MLVSTSFVEILVGLPVERANTGGAEIALIKSDNKDGVQICTLKRPC